MARGPLDHPKLAAVAKKLDEGELEEAQRLLAQLGDSADFRPATSYLTTRLLYQRKLLTEAQVAERIERLLTDVGDFPEALELLESARAGTLARGSPRERSSRPPMPSQLRRDEPGVRGADLRAAFGAKSERPPAPATDLKRPKFPGAAPLPSMDAEKARQSQPGHPPSIPDLEIPGGSVRAPGFDVVPEPRMPPAAREVDPAPRAAPADQETEADRSPRYSGSPIREEHVPVRKQIPSVVPPTEPAGQSPARRRPPQPTAPAIVSGAPPPVLSSVVTLFDIAKLLDAGKLDDALAALAALSSSEPDHVLMEARVLARMGRAADALERVERLSHAPLLEPEVRAGVSRLALELNQPEVAFDQARRAELDDPEQPMVNLSLAWAAMRWTRRSADAAAFAIGLSALRKLGESGGPNAALLLALRACAEAHAGQGERAGELARQSLDIEPTADGFAALAMAAATLGRADEVRRACTSLAEHEPEEARALTRTLERHGERLFALSTRRAPALSSEAAADAVWGPLELALVGDAPGDAWLRLSQLAEDTLSQLKRAVRHEPPALAAVAARFFTEAPVARDLAPFDETPHSLHRLEALLSLLAGGASPDDLRLDHPMVLMAGTYAGEVLRQALQLRWHGSVADGAATLEGGERSRAPFELVRDHLLGRAKLRADALLARAPKSALDLEPHLPAVGSPEPWAPAEWPEVEKLPSYASALHRSVIALVCRQRGGGLDGSVASLSALEGYLDLLAPPGAPRPADRAWARRPSVLVGAYLGQVLCDEASAKWVFLEDAASAPERFGVVTPAGDVAEPVAHVFARLTGDAAPIDGWAMRWLARHSR